MDFDSRSRLCFTIFQRNTRLVSCKHLLQTIPIEVELVSRDDGNKVLSVSDIAGEEDDDDVDATGDDDEDKDEVVVASFSSRVVDIAVHAIGSDDDGRRKTSKEKEIPIIFLKDE